jgi:hypothetical protein
VVFKLNGQTFDVERVDGALTTGQTDHWQLINEDIFEHPFHIHVNPFQVVAVNGQPYPEPDVWWDTFRLPGKGTVTIRTRYRADVVGKTVYHCHILPHEDNGMMSVITLNPPGGPFPHVDPKGPFATNKPIPQAGTPQTGGDSQQPYVFTQASHGMTALVHTGARAQIQLPGGPTQWRVDAISAPGVTLTGTTVIPSPGRIAGTDVIYQFDLSVQTAASVTLVAEPAVPGVPSPFVLTLQIGTP